MVVFLVLTGLLSGASNSGTVVVPTQPGGAGGVYRRLTPKQEAALDAAIANLADAESSFRQARTPRARNRKLKDTALHLETAQVTIESDAPEILTIDLSPLILQLHMLIEGQIEFSTQRQALADALAHARQQAAMAITHRNDEDDMLMLLMLTA